MDRTSIGGMRAQGIPVRLAIVFALALPAVTRGQALPVLDPPVPVDVRVESLMWHPKGEALLYCRAEGKGKGLGVYRVGADEGKVLVHLQEGDRWEAQWFEGAPCAIVITYRDHPVGKDKQIEATVHLLDARNNTARKVYGRTFAPGQRVDLNVDPSPGMIHAIFRVTDGKEQFHLVLPLSANTLLASPDLDRAVKEGFGGPFWSVDGTANYSKGGSAGRLASKLGQFSAANSARDAYVELTAQTLILQKSGGAKLEVLGDLPIIGNYFTVKLAAPAPPAGTDVLEVVPSNGVLRPVRFRGEWESRDPEGLLPLATRQSVSTLQLGVSQGQANSLWLIREGDKADQGVLIAAHGSRAWVAPLNAAVAYVTDGALFVRAMGERR